MAKNFLDYDGLAYVFTKIKALISSAVSVKAPLHAVANGIITEGSGAAYTATVEGITALTTGASFVMIPHTISTSKTPTLNVNGLGAKTLRRRVSNSTVTTVTATTTNWLGANKPVEVVYDGTYWIVDILRPNAADLYGTVAIANGGTGATTAEDALTNLGITATATELNYVDGVTSAIQTQLKNKQAKITVSSVTGKTKSITCGSTVTLTSLSLSAGTYLVFGNAKFPSASSTSGKYVIQCCLSTSTTYNHDASMAIPNNAAAASTLNPHGVFTLSSAGTIYLLGYHGGDSTMTVGNINLYAVKIG